MSLGRGITDLAPGQDIALIPDWTWPDMSFEGELQVDRSFCENKESRVVTISFTSVALAPINPLTDSVEGAYFRLKWTAGDAAQVAEIDMQNGSEVTVPANKLSINAVYPLTTIVGVTQPHLHVAASLGFYGSKAAVGITNSARRTVRVGALTANVPSAIFPIPDMAVSAVQRNESIAAALVSFFQLRSQNITNIVNANPLGKLDRDSVPVADGAEFFSVTSATNVTDESIVFYLAI